MPPMGAGEHVETAYEQWSRQESALHINGKELLTTFLAVQTFSKNKSAAHQAQGRQYDSRVLHKSHGGNQESISDEDHYTTLELVPAERHRTLSRTFTGSVECGSRSGVTRKR